MQFHLYEIRLTGATKQSIPAPARHPTHNRIRKYATFAGTLEHINTQSSSSDVRNDQPTFAADGRNMSVLSGT